MSWMMLATIAAALAAPAELTVTAEGAFARAMPPGTPASAAFVRLQNADTLDHAVTAASSPAAKTVELHTHASVDGVMKMRPIEAIQLAAGSTTVLEPGGLHIMLIDLAHPLVAGTEIPLTLTFEDGTSLALTVPVKAMGAGKHGKGHGAHAGAHGKQHGAAAGTCSCGGTCNGACKGGGEAEGAKTCGGSCDGSCGGH